MNQGLNIHNSLLARARFHANWYSRYYL